MDRKNLRARLEQQKQVYKTAESRRGQRPVRKPSKLELSALFNGRERPSLRYHIRQTVIGYAYPPCTTALANLKPMVLDDLRLETHHRHHVAIVRIFGLPAKLQAVQNAVEDGEGGVERLAVYNYDPRLRPSQMLPQGGYVAIKEPYYKMTGDGLPTIRVDHPTDLMNLEADHELIPEKLRPTLGEVNLQSASAMKEQGNAAYRAKKYHDAIDRYSRALRLCDGHDHLIRADLYRNRGVANLILQRYEAALSDAKAAIITDHDSAVDDVARLNGKTLYRAGCAAYHLSDFEKAKEFFNEVLGIESSDADALRELHRTNCRLAEQRGGHYDFEAMSKSVSKGHKRLDHASHTAKVAIRDTVDRRRGLFAVNDIKVGDLISCEKAFNVAYTDDDGDSTSIILNLAQDSARLGAHATNLVNTIHKLIHHPQQATEFLNLHDGGYKPETIEFVQGGLLAVDVFRVQAILEYNSFRCPSMSSLEYPTDSKPGASSGIWLTASYANHDCLGNATRAFIGDMMIVHANQDIERGKEITMRYKDPKPNPVAFQDNLQKFWKFRCSCMLCQAEVKVQSHHLARRVNQMKQARTFLASPSNQLTESNLPASATVREAEQLHKDIQSTYDEELFRSLPRPLLSDLDLWLCMAYTLRRPEKVLEQALALLRDNGIMLSMEDDDVAIDCGNSRLEVSSIHGAMYAAEAFERRGKMRAKQKLKELAMQPYRMAYGSMLGFDARFAID